MTIKQRENLIYLNGKIEGLTWGVESTAINDGLLEVVSAIDELLNEDAETKDVPTISTEGYR